MRMRRSSGPAVPDMHIDAHQHFWRLERGDYDWLTPALRPLYRDYLPPDLASDLDAAGVTATILVQAAATEPTPTGWNGLPSRALFLWAAAGMLDGHVN